MKFRGTRSDAERRRGSDPNSMVYDVSGRPLILPSENRPIERAYGGSSRGIFL